MRRTFWLQSVLRHPFWRTVSHVPVVAMVVITTPTTGVGRVNAGSGSYPQSEGEQSHAWQGRKGERKGTADGGFSFISSF